MYETSGLETKEGQDFQTAETTVRFLREQRHDFMNHIQVIWGYLQVGRADQSVKYIKDMNRKYDVLGKVLKLNNPVVSLFFYQTIKNAYNCGIAVDIEIDDIDINNYFAAHMKARIDILRQVIDEILKISLSRDNGKEIYIDMFEEDEVLHIEISNSRDLIIVEDENYDEDSMKSINDIKNGVSVIYHAGGNSGCQANISFMCI